jgi:hypothetical protein
MEILFFVIELKKKFHVLKKSFGNKKYKANNYTLKTDDEKTSNAFVIFFKINPIAEIHSYLYSKYYQYLLFLINL